MLQLWEQLKQRNVVRVAIAYVVAAWVILQAAELLFGIFELPNWILQALALVLLMGLPVACLFSWAYELTPQGLKRSDEVESDASLTPNTGRKIERVTIVLLVLLIPVLLWNNSGGFFGPQREAQSAAGVASIAVLPFADMSPNQDQGYFTDGISEELLNVLASNSGLRVAARTSSFAFKNRNEDIRQIAELLSVDHILEGSIRKAGNKVRITAQLISAADGYHMWSSTYDRELTDVFAVQDEIASAIHSALKLHLLDIKPTAPVLATHSAEAHEYLLLAKQKIHQRGPILYEAADDLNRALELDADFGPAHLALALTWTLLADSPVTYGNLKPEEVRARALPHFERARELMPDDPELDATYGFFMHVTGGEDRLALEFLNSALAENANLSIAYTWRAIIKRVQGDFAGALADDERAYALDPMSALAGRNLAEQYIDAQRLEDAERVVSFMERVAPGQLMAAAMRVELEIVRGDYVSGLLALEQVTGNRLLSVRRAALYEQLGMYEEAVAILPQLRPKAAWMQGDLDTAVQLAIDPDVPELPFVAWFYADLAAITALAGDLDRAESYLAQWEEKRGRGQCSHRAAFSYGLLSQSARRLEILEACLADEKPKATAMPASSFWQFRLARTQLALEQRESGLASLHRAYDLGLIVFISKHEPMYLENSDSPAFVELYDKFQQRVEAQRVQIRKLLADGTLTLPG